MSETRTFSLRQPRLAADCVVFDAKGRLLLIRRKNPPFKGLYALPGGFIELGETTEEAARRELKEETGVDAGPLRLIGVYSDPGRDPRGHTVSIAYLGEAAVAAVAQAGDDAAEAEFVASWKDQTFAFDHARIIADALALQKTP